MNGEQLIDAVLARGSWHSSDPVVNRASINTWLQEAADLSAAVTPRPPVWLHDDENLTIAIGFSSSLLPVDARRALEILYVTLLRSDGQRRVLERVSPESMSELATEEEGEPRIYSIQADHIWVWPTPTTETATLAVSFVRSETPLADDGVSIPVMPSELHHLLVEHACHRAYAAIGNPAMAALFAPITAPRSVSLLRRANASRAGHTRAQRAVGGNRW